MVLVAQFASQLTGPQDLVLSQWEPYTVIRSGCCVLVSGSRQISGYFSLSSSSSWSQKPDNLLILPTYHVVGYSLRNTQLTTLLHSVFETGHHKLKHKTCDSINTAVWVSKSNKYCPQTTECSLRWCKSTRLNCQCVLRSTHHYPVLYWSQTGAMP